MAVDDHVMQKILENRIHDSLVSETKGDDVGKLISFGNLLDREITSLVLPTTSVHLILSRAKEIVFLEPEFFVLFLKSPPPQKKKQEKFFFWWCVVISNNINDGDKRIFTRQYKQK